MCIAEEKVAKSALHPPSPLPINGDSISGNQNRKRKGLVGKLMSSVGVVECVVFGDE